MSDVIDSCLHFLRKLRLVEKNDITEVFVSESPKGQIFYVTLTFQDTNKAVVCDKSLRLLIKLSKHTLVEQLDGLFITSGQWLVG